MLVLPAPKYSESVLRIHQMPATDITQEKSGVHQKPKPSWKKSSPEEKECFTQVLKTKLDNVMVPSSMNCRNPTCDIHEHRTDSDNYIEEVLNTISESAGNPYPCLLGDPQINPHGAETQDGMNR